MRHSLLTILLSLLLSAVQAQMYVPGERLEYKMSYKAKLFPNTEVANVSIETSNATLDGQPAYKVYGIGQTARAFNWIFPVKDAYTIWIDPSTLRTKRFEADLQEGDYTRRSTFIFDQPNGKVYTRWQTRQRPVEHRTLEITRNGMDAISLYFNMRSARGEEDKEPGPLQDAQIPLQDSHLGWLRLRGRH